MKQQNVTIVVIIMFVFEYKHTPRKKVKCINKKKKLTYNRFPSGRHLLKIENEKQYQHLESTNFRCLITSNIYSNNAQQNHIN